LHKISPTDQPAQRERLVNAIDAVRKPPFLHPFYTQNGHFAKTNIGKVEKTSVFRRACSTRIQQVFRSRTNLRTLITRTVGLQAACGCWRPSVNAAINTWRTRLGKKAYSVHTRRSSLLSSLGSTRHPTITQMAKQIMAMQTEQQSIALAAAWQYL
jgi:hypothetical protein